MEYKNDNIKTVLAVIIFIIVIVIITAVIYNFIVINNDYQYNDSDYNTNYNNNYNHKITYYCDSDYTLINNQCHKKDVINATKEYQCYSGSLRGTECITETSHLAYTNKTCPYGYVLMGSDCIVIGTHQFSSNCNFNETYNSMTNTCHRKIKPTEEYQCYSGKLRFNKCITETKIPAIIVYTCPIGYTQSYSICTKDIIIPAKIK